MLKKLLALLMAVAFSAAFAQWDGGDDLPTSPLPCGTEAAPAMAGKDYDGGMVTMSGDMMAAGSPINIVDVPKLIGIGYFDATSAGIQEAAKELGNVTAKTDGPTEANIDDQIAVIEC
jgi:rhamnose transport system substrate-binding protein